MIPNVPHHRFARIAFVLLLSGILTGDIYGQPIKFSSPPSGRLLLMDKADLSFRVDPKIVDEYRFKLDVPGDWKGGLRWSVLKWSDWRRGTGEGVALGRFEVEGTYRFTVEYKTKGSSSTKQVSHSFKVYWEYPEIRSEAININNAFINSAPTEKEKFRRASEEYKKAYDTWLKKFDYEARRLELTQTPEEMVKIISETIVMESSALIIASVGGPVGIKALFAGSTLYALIRQGYTSLALVYRNRAANHAATMASTSYAAYLTYERKYRSL